MWMKQRGSKICAAVLCWMGFLQLSTANLRGERHLADICTNYNDYRDSSCMRDGIYVSYCSDCDCSLWNECRNAPSPTPPSPSPTPPSPSPSPSPATTTSSPTTTTSTGNCSDTNNGKLDAEQRNCDYYTTDPSQCGLHDDIDFRSEWFCCACGGGWAAECHNTDFGATDTAGDPCTDYEQGREHHCDGYDDEDFTSSVMCCACGGGSTYLEPTTTAAPTTTTTAASPQTTHPNGCYDTSNGALDTSSDPCSYYVTREYYCGMFDDEDFQSELMCCACGGGSTHTTTTTTLAPTTTAAPPIQQTNVVVRFKLYLMLTIDPGFIMLNERFYDAFEWAVGIRIDVNETNIRLLSIDEADDDGQQETGRRLVIQGPSFVFTSEYAFTFDVTFDDEALAIAAENALAILTTDPAEAERFLDDILNRLVRDYDATTTTNSSFLIRVVVASQEMFWPAKNVSLVAPPTAFAVAEAMESFDDGFYEVRLFLLGAGVYNDTYTIAVRTSTVSRVIYVVPDDSDSQWYESPKAIVGLSLATAVISVLIFSVIYYTYHKRSVNRKDRAITQQTKTIVTQQEDITNMKKAWKLTWSEVSLTKKIGQGGAGEVWRGKLHGNMPVVVKLICDEDADMSNDQEINFLMRARHPRLILFMGCGERKVTSDDGVVGTQAFLVLEAMEHSLDALVWKQKRGSNAPPTWETRLQWARDVAEGMQYLHCQLNSIHRDLKTPNVLISHEGGLPRAKVADFGLAKIVKRDKILAEAALHRKKIRERMCARSSSTNMTTDTGHATPPPHAKRLLENKSLTRLRAGSNLVVRVASGAKRLMSPSKQREIGVDEKLIASADLNTGRTGTPLWMSPELCRKGKIRKLSDDYTRMVDVYAFGMILWEMLELTRPWSNSHFKFSYELLDKVAAGGRPSISSDREREAPPGYVKLLRRCWAQRADARPEFPEIFKRLGSIQNRCDSKSSLRSSSSPRSTTSTQGEVAIELSPVSADGRSARLRTRTADPADDLDLDL